MSVCTSYKFPKLNENFPRNAQKINHIIVQINRSQYEQIIFQKNPAITKLKYNRAEAMI